MELQQILDELGISENDYLEEIQDYIEQLTEDFSNLNYACETENFNQISKIAGSIKQRADALKLQDITDITYQIELQGKNKAGLEFINRGVEELERAFQNLQEQYTLELV